MTAFVSLVFGYFFYWTARPDFPPDRDAGSRRLWPSLALALLLGAWLLHGAGAAMEPASTPAALFYAALVAAAAAGRRRRGRAACRAVADRPRSDDATSTPRSSGCS